MNTLEVDLEIGADGSVRLLSPLPPGWRSGVMHAVLTPAEAPAGAPRPKRQIPLATPEMIAARMAALEKVRAFDPYRDIADPVAWQRELRGEVR